MNQSLTMEEDRILARFHQQVQKARDKAWHDIHIKKKMFREGYLVLMYDIKSLQDPGKIIIHCLGPYKVLAQGKTQGSMLQQHTNKTLAIGPFDNICEANEVSPEVEAGVVTGLKCLQP
jgi:hypothetical protein